MSRQKAIALTMLCVAITAFAIWRLATASNDADARWTLGGALFFGGASCVALGGLFSARISPMRADGAMEILHSPVRHLLMGVGLVIIIGGAIAMSKAPAPGPGGMWRVFALYVFPVPCAAFALVTLLGAFSTKPIYRLDGYGLTQFGWGGRSIAWRDVADVRLHKDRGARYILFDFTPEKRQDMSWCGRLTKAMGLGDASIGEQPGGVPVQKLEPLVMEYWRKASPQSAAPKAAE